jgi:hypothetical protein
MQDWHFDLKLTIMKDFIDFIKLFKQEPIKVFSDLLSQPKYRYLYLIVTIFGFILGFNGIINKIYLAKIDLETGNFIFSMIKTIVITFIVLYAFSWIVMYLNSIFQGFSNQKDIFAVIVYSLVPLIIGTLMISIFKIILFSVGGLQGSIFGIIKLFYVVYLIFYFATLIYLIIGNAIVNNFSIIKSIISTSILPIIYTIFESIKILK